MSRDVHELNRSVTTLAMIETVPGLANVDDICKVCRVPCGFLIASDIHFSDAHLQVEGLDGVFVGPYDLSLAMGLPAPDPKAQTEEMQQALKHICATATAAGLVPGIHCGDAEMLSRMLDMGFKFCTVATDVENAAAGLRQLTIHGASRARVKLADEAAPEKRKAAPPIQRVNHDDDDSLIEAAFTRSARGAGGESDILQTASLMEDAEPPAAMATLAPDEKQERLQKLKADKSAWQAECAAWADGLEVPYNGSRQDGPFG